MKTVLITGATGGLGSTVAEVLHGHGYQICATAGAHGMPESLKAIVADVQQVDLTDEFAAGAYIRTLTQQYPDLEAGILLVGGFAAGDIHTTDFNAIDKQIALNFKTAYSVVKPLLEFFAQRGGGQFVLVGARPALEHGAGKDMVAYALSKSLVLQLANIINADGNKKHIRATVIVPSTLDTEANRATMPGADFSRWVNTDDVAQTIAFVLSDTGAILRDTVLKVYGDA